MTYKYTFLVSNYLYACFTVCFIGFANTLIDIKQLYAGITAMELFILIFYNIAKINILK
jgi:hypothetical protein